jgi:hypothetical protein
MAPLLPVSSAGAQEYVWVGSVRLRGGFDSNPTLISPAEGSVFSGIDAAIAGGATTEDYAIGVIGELGATTYADSSITRSQHALLELTLKNSDPKFWSLKSTTTFADDRDYDERLSNATQSLRAQWVGGPIRPFLTLEGGYARLNETSAIYLDFLPEPHKTLRGTVIPGIALHLGGLELGSSVNLTAIRYAEEFDDFGFRRDNERIQPFLFGSYEWNGLSLSGTISHLFGDWHDPDFSDVSERLYDVTLGFSRGPVSLEISASRATAETTFPVSPIAVNQTVSGRIDWSLSSATTIAGYGNHQKTEYLDFPLHTETLTIGGQLIRELGDGLSITFDLSQTQSTDFFDNESDSTLAFIALKKAFGSKQ